MAFLFGSYVKGQAIFDSDVDIAVYFKPKERRLEWEEVSEYPEESKIWTDTEKILGKNVDVLVLNKAPSLIAFDVLRTGIPLIIKDRSLYLRFLLLISSSDRDARHLEPVKMLPVTRKGGRGNREDC